MHVAILAVRLLEQFGEPHALVLPERVMRVDVFCHIAGVQLGFEIQNARDVGVTEREVPARYRDGGRNGDDQPDRVDQTTEGKTA